MRTSLKENYYSTANKENVVQNFNRQNLPKEPLNPSEEEKISDHSSKRPTEKPRKQYQEITIQEDTTKMVARKQKRIVESFKVKNIKFNKAFWREILANDLNREASFVEYHPSEHSYKVKPAYLSKVKEVLVQQILRFGIAYDVINVPFGYTLTTLSLKNFLEHNYYSEEIINALLFLYQNQANQNGYLLFNTFAYLTVQKVIKTQDYTHESGAVIDDLK